MMKEIVKKRDPDERGINEHAQMNVDTKSEVCVLTLASS